MVAFRNIPMYGNFYYDGSIFTKVDEYHAMFIGKYVTSLPRYFAPYNLVQEVR